jgi:CDGSH-type Zn-finger protein
VFKPKDEPWIDTGGASKDEIIRTIRQCPSGALSYSVDGVEHRDRGGEPGVSFVPNGPYVVKGGCELQGEEFPQGGTQDHFTLCRCGQSKNKPFCNGAHWYHKFDEDAPE